MHLYQLTASYAELQSMMESEEFSISAVKDTLDSIEEEINLKAENIAKLIRSLDSDAKALKDEEERLANRRRSLEGRKDFLKIYLQDQVKTLKDQKIKTKLFTMWIQDNPPGIQVDSPESIPVHFWISQEPVLDKKAVLEATKAGQHVPGITLSFTRSLRIR